jgi:HEAT repeat protein
MAARGFCLILVSLLPLAAQQPRITNAKMQTRSASAGLEKEFRTLVGNLVEPAWIGYAVPVIAGRHQMCCHSNGSACVCGLEGKRGDAQSFQAGSVKLEGPGHLLVLFRVEQKSVGKIRTFSEDCELDAGGLPLYWLTEVRPPESVALLSSFVSDGEQRLSDSAVAAIALHADVAADGALEKLASNGQPEKVRERTAFWLGAVRGKRGYELLRRMLRDDPSAPVRDKVVFALSISKEPEAVGAMIDAARNDKSPHVRGQALFWLAQKAGKQAASAITEAIEKDPETEVKKRAVFALSQLPKEEGVPLLIQVARTNRNPVARKQAIFWLGQSKDPRALSFFEEVLKK